MSATPKRLRNAYRVSIFLIIERSLEFLGRLREIESLSQKASVPIDTDTYAGTIKDALVSLE